MSTRIFSIDNPDDPMGMPAFEGDLSEIAARFTAGEYTGTDYATGAPVVITVGDSSVPATARIADWPDDGQD